MIHNKRNVIALNKNICNKCLTKKFYFKNEIIQMVFDFMKDKINLEHTGYKFRTTL